MRHWQETYNQTGVLRLGHPRGQKAVNDDLLFNRTPFTLDGASLTVHLMPRIFNSIWTLQEVQPPLPLRPEDGLCHAAGVGSVPNEQGADGVVALR